METHKTRLYTQNTLTLAHLLQNHLLIIFRFLDGSFLRTLATSLIDFNELSSVAALSQLLEVCHKIILLF